jgi:murein L,D-transpeptidase YcbB/YkuD
MRIAAAILAVGIGVSGCGPRIDNETHVVGIQKVVNGTPGWVDRTPLGKRLWTIERTFYENRAYLPAWINGDRTTAPMKDLTQALGGADAHGLDHRLYGTDEFERVRAESQTRFRGTRFPVEQVPELDARLTYAYLRYGADLLGWSSSPTALTRYWSRTSPTEDLAALLEAAIAGNTVSETLEGLAPSHSQYKGLQAALLREQAQPSGEVERIRMNLERWRWAPRALGDRYILVNIPSYMLQVMEGDRPVLAMRTIVGQPSTPTPIFSDEMTYIVFSPYWNIPENILRNETLPRVMKDPDFLRRNNIEVVGTSGVVDPSSIDWLDESAAASVRFRQRPGPDNALGLVKFIFPNNFDIYLHDTPTERLFFREKRTFSHGCIRIENPVAFAEYLLRDQPEWSGPRIQQAMHARQERSVKLMAPIPVHIGYWTAWVGPDGRVSYLDDPYGLDRTHERAVRRAARSR